MNETFDETVDYVDGTWIWVELHNCKTKYFTERAIVKAFESNDSLCTKEVVDYKNRKKIRATTTLAVKLLNLFDNDRLSIATKDRIVILLNRITRHNKRIRKTLYAMPEFMKALSMKHIIRIQVFGDDVPRNIQQFIMDNIETNNTVGLLTIDRDIQLSMVSRLAKNIYTHNRIMDYENIVFAADVMRRSVTNTVLGTLSDDFPLHRISYNISRDFYDDEGLKNIFKEAVLKVYQDDPFDAEAFAILHDDCGSTVLETL